MRITTCTFDKFQSVKRKLSIYYFHEVKKILSIQIKFLILIIMQEHQ